MVHRSERRPDLLATLLTLVTSIGIDVREDFRGVRYRRLSSLCVENEENASVLIGWA